MLNFLKQVGDYAKETVQSARYIGQGMAVTFDYMRRRPITVQYPYEKLIPSERCHSRQFLIRVTKEYQQCNLNQKWGAIAVTVLGAVGLAVLAA